MLPHVPCCRWQHTLPICPAFFSPFCILSLAVPILLVSSCFTFSVALSVSGVCSFYSMHLLGIRSLLFGINPEELSHCSPTCSSISSCLAFPCTYALHPVHPMHFICGTAFPRTNLSILLHFRPLNLSQQYLPAAFCSHSISSFCTFPLSLSLCSAVSFLFSSQPSSAPCLSVLQSPFCQSSPVLTVGVPYPESRFTPLYLQSHLWRSQCLTARSVFIVLCQLNVCCHFPATAHSHFSLVCQSDFRYALIPAGIGVVCFCLLVNRRLESLNPPASVFSGL